MLGRRPGTTTGRGGAHRKIVAMRWPRLLPPSGLRSATGAAALAVVMVAAGCSGDEVETGPPRVTPVPNHDAARAMIEGGPVDQERLNACELLDLTVEEVIDLTRATMPEVEPTGSGDLGLICTYGGPGSTERADGGTEDDGTGDDEAKGEDRNDDTVDPDSTGATTSTTATTTATSTSAASSDSGPVPDTFAAGVTMPIGDVKAALAGQQKLLGNRYACTAIRGADADSVTGAPESAPGSPPPTQPGLDTAYIDCVASPTGGGVEAHTILISGDYLWHITLLKPETERSDRSSVSAIAGLHRVAEHILDQ